MWPLSSFENCDTMEMARTGDAAAAVAAAAARSDTAAVEGGGEHHRPLQLRRIIATTSMPFYRLCFHAGWMAWGVYEVVAVDSCLAAAAANTTATEVPFEFRALWIACVMFAAVEGINVLRFAYETLHFYPGVLYVELTSADGRVGR